MTWPSLPQRNLDPAELQALVDARLLCWEGRVAA